MTKYYVDWIPDSDSHGSHVSYNGAPLDKQGYEKPCIQNNYRSNRPSWYMIKLMTTGEQFLKYDYFDAIKRLKAVSPNEKLERKRLENKIENILVAAEARGLNIETTE